MTITKKIRRLTSLARHFFARPATAPQDDSGGDGSVAPPAKSEQAIVSSHWSEQFERMRADSGYWTNNTIVTRHVYRLISRTGERHWLPWTFHEHFPPGKRFARALSVCCGDGAHEIALYKTGKVDFIHGFDISEGAVRQARDRFEKENVPEDCYRFDVRDANQLELHGQYDLVLSGGAIHHVSNLEGLLSTLARSLTPDGYMVLVEFVGPTRFQWTDEQIAVINRILQAIDPAYLKNHERATFERPTVEDMIALDPSEAVRSEEILDAIDRYFDVELQRPYHGTIIHQLYPLLNNQLTNKQDPGFDSIVRLVLVMEDLLISSGMLKPDFVYMICRPKR